MTSKTWIAALTAFTLAAAPAAADRVLTLKSHSDAMQVMGQTTPAKDETHRYWFGADAVRFDAGDFSYLVRFDAKKMYWIDHTKKRYSAIDLPVDLKQLVPPEMAPMLEQMMTMMGGSAKVTETDRTGQFGGYGCKFAQIEVTMAMVSVATESCLSRDLPVDYARYKELVVNQSQLFPNTRWMGEMAKLEGFPVRSESTTTMMGKSFKSWQELVAAEDQPAPAGTYEPPAGYKEQAFDPLGAGSNRR